MSNHDLQPGKSQVPLHLLGVDALDVLSAEINTVETLPNGLNRKHRPEQIGGEK